MPLLRTVKLEFKKAKTEQNKSEAFVENNWVEHLLIFTHNRNTLMPTFRPHLFFSNDRMHAIFYTPIWDFPRKKHFWET